MYAEEIGDTVRDKKNEASGWQILVLLAIQRVKCQNDGETGRRQQDRHKISKTIE